MKKELKWRYVEEELEYPPYYQKYSPDLLQSQKFKDIKSNYWQRVWDQTREREILKLDMDGDKIRLVMLRDEEKELDTFVDDPKSIMVQKLQSKFSTFNERDALALIRNDFLKGTKDKSHVPFFEKSVQKHQNLNNQIQERLQDKLTYAQIFKRHFDPLIQASFAKDPKFLYFKQCLQDSELELPVLEYVREKTLCLRGYTLSIGHCKALAKVFGQIEHFCNRIILDNCGVDDKEFSTIIRGIKELKDFKKIVYRYNKFDELSLGEIKDLLKRKIPNHLEELSIENCQIQTYISKSLLSLIHTKSCLHKLCLVKANLNDECFQLICQILKNSPFMIDLDLSWNNFKPNSFIAMFEELANNKTLQYLSLANNTIIDTSTVIKEEIEDWKKFNQRALARRELMPVQRFPPEEYDPEKDGLDLFPENLSENSQYAMECLCKFIKRNPSLIHVNLSTTGLNEKALWYFGKAIRRSKSIRSLHLSGNPGITEKIKDYIHQRAHCMTFEPKNYIEFSQLPSTLELKEFYRERKLKIEGKSKNKKDSKPIKWGKLATMAEKYEERSIQVIRLKEIFYHKRNEVDFRTNPNPDSSTLLLTRKLGHKTDIPGSGQWKMITHQRPMDNECWVTDKELFSLILWNDMIGSAQMSIFDQRDKEFIIEKIKTFSTDEIMRMSTQSLNNDSSPFTGPHIFGEFTNWKPKKMFEIKEFCSLIDCNQPDFKKIMSDQYAAKGMKLDLDHLSVAQLQSLNRDKQNWQQSYLKNWKEVLDKNLMYSRPNYVNIQYSKLIDHPNAPLYIFPCFLKTGKQYYCVKNFQFPFSSVNKNLNQTFQVEEQKRTVRIRGSQESIYSSMQSSKKYSSRQEAFYLGSTVVGFRQEPIPDFNKFLKSHTKTRVFRKDQSVFAAWKQDDDETIRRCIDHDTKYWKCERFIKELDEYRALLKLVKTNFSLLKDNHLFLCCNSVYPATDRLDFTIFGRKIGLVDKNVLQSDIDRLFIATNVELDQQDENPDKELIRFEFIELLIRIAIEKYRRFGTAKTVSEAFQMLLDTNLIPNSKHHEWQGFREHLLWTLDVNDVIEPNLENLKTVYNSYLTILSKVFLLENAIDLFLNKSDLGMTEKDVVYCFGMSKLTIPDENSDGSKKYKKMQFVEFLEMIGRVADLKCRGSEMEILSLGAKIEIVLEEVFFSFGLKVRKLREDQFEVTDSDSDY